jgi:hypothetical protein
MWNGTEYKLLNSIRPRKVLEESEPRMKRISWLKNLRTGVLKTTTELFRAADNEIIKAMMTANILN